MSEEMRKEEISIEEMIAFMIGTEKEIFGYETDNLVMFNKKLILEQEMKLKLFELKKELKNERLEKDTIYKLVKKIIYETFGKGNFFLNLNIRRKNEENLYFRCGRIRRVDWRKL